MNRFLFDTNALIDLAVTGRPQHNAAYALLTAITDRDETPLAFAGSLKDVYYICCKHYSSEAQARWLIRRFRRIFELVPLDSEVIDEALRSTEPDFEDGLVRAAAELAACACIVSRDEGAFVHSFCQRLSPQEALKQINR